MFAVPRRGAGAFVELLLTIPSPSPSPMFHAYANAVPGDALALQIPITTLRPTKVGPGTYASPDDPRARPYDAVVMPVRLENRAPTPLVMTLANEWYGGPWRPTDLHACTRTLDDGAPDAAPAKWFCQQAYVAPERRERGPDRELRRAEAIEVPIRMDWQGTGSIHGTPLMPLGRTATYEVQLIAFYRQDGAWRFTLGPVTRVSVQASP